MSKLPIVAIIGRPNVGKSTLFNRLVRKRHAIESAIPGTTRDQVTLRVEGEEVSYLLMDTGGMGGGSTDTDFEEDVAAQSLLALSHADLILFVIDGRQELTASDRAVADLLRRTRRKHVPVFTIIAKCDTDRRTDDAKVHSYALGIADDIFIVSALHGLGLEELRAAIAVTLKKQHFGQGRKKVSIEGEESGEGVERKEGAPRIAIVGRPNVGKSSLVNALMSDEERKVSARLTGPLPGTTRDTTDTTVRFQGKEYVLVDTAGLRKKSRVKEELESIAVIRALQAINEADVTVLVLDALSSLDKQDKHIAGIALEGGTGLILLVNKMDLLKAGEKDEVRKRIAHAFRFCPWAPVLFTSAVTRENLPTLFRSIDGVCENRTRRIPTPTLNRLIRDLGDQHPSLSGRGFPFKYATQVEIAPPTFALFLKDPKRLHVSSLRFLENRIRELYAFDGTPIRWIKKGGEKT